MSYLKQRQTTIFREGGDPSAIPQERPGPFVPRGGKRAISIDSCALLRATARRRVPVYQRCRISSSAKIEILNAQNGLYKKTYSGEWENCDEMIKGELVEESASTDFSIDEYRKNNFGHSFSGYLQIDKEGTYEFQTSSDDGSRLFIDGFPVVDNDGLHGRQVAKGEIPLELGFHEIRLDYFERGGQQSLDVKWKGPGFDWRTIPSFMLFKGNEHLKK